MGDRLCRRTDVEAARGEKCHRASVGHDVSRQKRVKLGVAHRADGLGVQDQRRARVIVKAKGDRVAPKERRAVIGLAQCPKILALGDRLFGGASRHRVNDARTARARRGTGKRLVIGALLRQKLEVFPVKCGGLGRGHHHGIALVGVARGKPECRFQRRSRRRFSKRREGQVLNFGTACRYVIGERGILVRHRVDLTEYVVWIAVLVKAAATAPDRVLPRCLAHHVKQKGVAVARVGAVGTALQSDARVGGRLVDRLAHHAHQIRQPLLHELDPIKATLRVL